MAKKGKKMRNGEEYQPQIDADEKGLVELVEVVEVGIRSLINAEKHR